MSLLPQRLMTSLRFLAGSAEGPFAPEEVIFEVTTACNLACPMCARTALAPPRPSLKMDLATFRGFLARIPGSVRRIAFAGLGEPLINPDLAGMVAEVARSGRRCELYTNGTLLDRDAGRVLVLAGLTGIIIPMDGATHATYERYRAGASFDTTVRNVRDLLDVRRELRAPLFIELQMLRLPGTETEVRDWRRTWAAAGVDSLRYKHDHMGTGQLAASDPHSPIPKPQSKGVCPMPWRGPATVDVLGKVYPCCVQSEQNAILGNLGDNDLLTIWNGRTAIDLRVRFAAAGRKLKTCKGCLIPLPPRVVSAAGNLLDPIAARRLLSRTDTLLHALSGLGRHA